MADSIAEADDFQGQGRPLPYPILSYDTNQNNPQNNFSISK
jgi:hypothetical protein